MLGRSLLTIQVLIGRAGHLIMVCPLPHHSTGINDILNCACASRSRLIAVRSNAIQELARSFSRINRLSHLETINFTFYPINARHSDRGSRHALQLSIFDALVTSFRDRGPSKLTSLSLHNLRTLDHPFESPSFQNILKTLRYFQLSVLYDISRDEWLMIPSRWSRFWGNLCPRMVLAPMQHALRELTLHSDAFVGASSGLSLAGLHFPHLHALSLRNLVFDPSIGVQPFILLHSTSLAKLELLTCKLPTTGILFAPSWDPSPPSFMPFWDRIWDQFATELTALVALHIDDTECSYVDIGLGRLYNLDSDRKAQDATDFAALKRFHSVVTARSEEMRGES